MKLINVPACTCRRPYDSVFVMTENESYCATCMTVQRAVTPHSVDVPDEISDVVLGLTKVAHMRVIELSPNSAGQTYGEIAQRTRIRAVKDPRDCECRIEWTRLRFPLTQVRADLNTLRGKTIDLHKLPTAATPQMRVYLSGLRTRGFLVTQIYPMGNEMVMDLEKWFGKEYAQGDQTPNEKLVVRIRISWSTDVLKGIQEVLNSLWEGAKIDYTAEVRPLVASSLEAGFASYSLCLALLKRSFSYADERLAQEGKNLSCGEREALFYVADYAQYHIKCIERRADEFLCDEPAFAQTESDKLLDARPRKITEFRSEVSDAAKGQIGFIDAVYSLFLRLPADVIKMEAALKMLTAGR
jgi:hypothetical protein